MVKRLAGVVIMAACGGGSDTPQVDARVDATSTPPGSYTVCRMGVPEDCPGGFTCQVRNVPGGSTTMGYCSPPCTTNPECEVGYVGPGTPTCFMTNACVLVCTAMCPTGLSCLPAGGPVDVCVVPQ